MYFLIITALLDLVPDTFFTFGCSFIKRDVPDTNKKYDFEAKSLLGADVLLVSLHLSAEKKACFVQMFFFRLDKVFITIKNFLCSSPCPSVPVGKGKIA